MDKESYEAIKLKLEQDEMEVELEISKLLEKRNLISNRKNLEERKLEHVTKILVEHKVVKAAMLKQDYNHILVEKSEKEIAKIDEFIDEYKKEIEKIKEQRKYLEQIYMQKIKEKEAKAKKIEEEMLYEMKSWSDF